MGIFIDKETLCHEVNIFFSTVTSSHILIHSDLLKLGLVKAYSTQRNLELYESLFQAQSKTILIPSFNYNFCSGEIYSTKTSLSQIGALSKFLCKLHFEKRTQTPVFNFIILNNKDITLQPVKNPFGTESTFSYLRKVGATIAFWGADFSSNTFIHHIEELLNVPYRYIKKFTGKINVNSSSTESQHTLEYRVRPTIDGACEYDWEKIKSDLYRNNLLLNFKIGNSTVEYFNAETVSTFWVKCLEENIHYFLTERSRSIVESLYNEYERPLTFEKMEN